MGIDEGGGKQKREIGLVAKNAVYGKWVGGGAEGEAQRQDSAQEILKTAQWKVATERKR